MTELDFLPKTANLANKSEKAASSQPIKEPLHTMTPDQLARMLMSADMSKPANASKRHQVIKQHQEREGNAFVDRLIGKSSGLVVK
jgi:hypothetical protein